MKRRHFLPALAGFVGACGDDMRGKVIVAGHLAAALPALTGAFQGSVLAGDPYNILGLSSAQYLYAGFDPETGTTLHTTLLPFSASHPPLTISGALAQNPALGLRIQCRSATTYDWSIQNGWGWANGIGTRGATIPNGSSVLLGDTGITAAFAAGTYDATCNYRATAGRLASFGPTANCDLDNSSVYASNGLLIERWGKNNRRPALYRRNETGVSPGALGNAGALAGLVSGLNKPWEIWDVGSTNSSNTSTSAAADWSFSSSSNNSDNYITAVNFGPDVEASGAQQRYVFNRCAPGESSATAATCNLPLTESWYVRRLSYDGSALMGWMNGQPMWNTPQAWTCGSLSPNRFLLNAIRLGNGAVGNLPFKYNGIWLGYSATLTDRMADELWTALS